MATFKYSAFDADEKNLKGFINASDSDEAKLILKNRGLNPLNIEKTLQKIKITISNNNFQYLLSKCQLFYQQAHQ